MQEEIFGPILPVLGVDGPSEAKAFVGGPPQAARPLRVRQQDDVVDDIVDAHHAAAACA